MARNIILYHGLTPFEGDSTESRPIGGSETAMIYLMRELAKLGYEPTVICRCERPGNYHGVEYLNLESAREALEGRGADIFIAQTSTDVFNMNIRAKLKIFWTGGNHDVRVLQALKAKGLQKKINFFSFKSHWQADNFVKKFGIAKEKVVVIPNGYNQAPFDEKIEKVKYRLIYFSSPSRGLDILLDVFPGIRRRFKDAELHIFSDYEFYGQTRGDGAKEHPEIFKKINQPGVFSFGNIKRGDLIKEIKKAWVMAYPTHFRETFCTAALETQAAGTPPVATSLAALPEIIVNGKTGVLLHGDARSWIYKWRFSRAIQDLLVDEHKWSQMSEAGKVWARENFTWQNIASKWDRLFKERLK